MCTFESKGSGFQATVAEKVKYHFKEMFCRVISSLSTLFTAGINGIGDSVTEPMGPLQEITATMEVEMTIGFLNIASNKGVNQ